ncbi:transcription-repair coupling factor (superfamily II helicase) [Hypnocyclicus thermotrophus]|uniref:Transcription-repair-coupling factor n=1 Tax=Hypnocyclicus thermotrophus TaxID=1627895 RepID=A0AA46I5D4_9FUSO|nr:transcription-repair coupling factor [Hypnocyclicus thermotrophus]TDT69838.1 transcription-repair coupling factor (superfamily II helicase) [Hypnocyclicus thermotrophus]
MNFTIDLEEKEIYRGKIPFFLMNKNKNIIYLSGLNKNIDDYYFGIKDFSNKNLLKIENYNYTDIEWKEKNIELLNILKKENSIIFISLNAVFKEYFSKIKFFTIYKEKEYKINKIIKFLEENGYTRNYIIESIGEYSIRGDIIDIFSPSYDHPIRLEFFDNFLEDIRYFDIDTQKSIEKIEHIDINSNIGNSEKYSFLELLNKLKYKNYEIIIENKEFLDYKLEEYILNNREKENKIREEYAKIIFDNIHIFTKRLNENFVSKLKDYDYIKEYSKNKTIYIFTEEKRRYEEIFKGYKNIIIERKNYFEGFETAKELVITDRELKGIRVVRLEKRKEGLKLKNINQIIKGDYVIHENHGVGIYLGIEEIDNKDYLAIKYADADKLYVPIDGINKIEKYINEPGKIPEIYNLGRKGFKKRKEKIRKDIEEFAKELVQIQAKREAAVGFKFSKDTVWQEEFEEGFPYNETKDQLKAINDTKRDMESYKVMDRIVCGDVGYGKTEIALRAAFKAVMDGKQVVMLTPTTVLAHQHYERFIERFKNFPVDIKLLSRLESRGSQNKVVEGLKNGSVDIVIGTHRLLSTDISFKDLGLIIIDEEQKFGVKAKEKLKTLRIAVDTLTLTATPIPRTLNLALLGIRDISIIETAPENRKPVEIKFLEKEKNKIKEVILKEKAREGQIFYLFNSIKGMENKLNELRKILPDYIEIDFIHGQMPANQIKEKIVKFENGEFDLLLTTTIIENGIDIVNANTIIIEGIEKLGLAQIYQLKGRVGRGNKKGYCYLLLEKERKLSKKTKLRKETLENINVLGGGFQLSLEDMRIRGAGEILGDKQHGAIDTFGYDLYIKMLNEEMKKLKNEEIQKELYIDINKKGYIPNDYINETEKIRVYKRILSCKKIIELKELKNEIIDRFSKMPKETEELFEYYEIKLLAKEVGILELIETKEGYFMKLDENKIEIDRINVLILKGKLKYISTKKAIIYNGNIKKFLINLKEGEN